MSQPQYPIQGRWVYQNDPELFDTLRKHTLSHLQATLGRVLGKADDWLFDLAQKEGSVDGSASLDAMRVLRQSRSSFETAFTRHFEQGFEGLLRQIEQARGTLVLSLVEEDQLEAQLASEVLVDALIRAHGAALDAVERRFASMIGVVELKTGLNPLSATSLANALQASQSEVPLPDNIRVVLFKIYERELVSTLGELLTELNARMSNAGILPELGNPRPVESEVAAAGGTTAPAAGSADWHGATGVRGGVSCGVRGRPGGMPPWRGASSPPSPRTTSSPAGPVSAPRRWGPMARCSTISSSSRPGPRCMSSMPPRREPRPASPSAVTWPVW